MKQDKLVNKNRVGIGSRWKALLLKIRYGKALQLLGVLRVLGEMPKFKLPGESKIILGDYVVLNSDSVLSNTALTYRCTLICGLNGVIEVGENSILNGVAITAYKKVKIGRNCQIASCTMICDTDFHPIDTVMRKRQALGYKIDFNTVNKEEVHIGDNVWIGWGSIVLKGVHIADNSIVAAGSVVFSNVPANVIVAGSPAKVVKHLD